MLLARALFVQRFRKARVPAWLDVDDLRRMFLLGLIRTAWLFVTFPTGVHRAPFFIGAYSQAARRVHRGTNPDPVPGMGRMLVRLFFGPRE